MGPFCFAKSETRMKQIMIEIDDEAFEPFMGMLRLCPAVKVVGTSDDADSCSTRDRCVATAIAELQQNDVIRYASDYTFIMLLVNQGMIDKKLFYTTPLDYIAYLQQIGVNDIPGKSRIYLMLGLTCGKYPEWTFSDKPGAGETTRRNNVARQFLSAYFRNKRTIAEGLAEKK